MSPQNFISNQGIKLERLKASMRAGSILETYSCPQEGVLQVESITEANGKEERCIQIYRKLD